MDGSASCWVTTKRAWYSLGEGGITEGPYRWSMLEGWYYSGAVAPDLLMSNGGEWKELSVFMNEAAAEATAIAARESRAASLTSGAVVASTKWKQLRIPEAIRGKASVSASHTPDKSINSLMGIKNSNIPDRESRLQAMWYIVSVDSTERNYLGPYQGSLIHSWAYWGDIASETLVAQASIRPGENAGESPIQDNTTMTVLEAF